VERRSKPNIGAVVHDHHGVGRTGLRVEPIKEIDHLGRTSVRAQDPDQLPPMTQLRGRAGRQIHRAEGTGRVPVARPSVDVVANSLHLMRLLFVSSTTVGGSGRSQRELAARLAALGHEVRFLVDLDRAAWLPRRLYEQLSDASVRWSGRPGSALIRWLEALPGRRPDATEIEGIPHLASPVPENAVSGVLDAFRPDVVVGSSVLRLTWRKVLASCRTRGTTTVLYVREVEAMNHFDSGQVPADAVVANAESLARGIEALGVPCAVFPSVVEVDVTKVESSRRVALAINPIASRGIETIWQMAQRLPDVPFVVQESWPLDREDLERVERRASQLENVELRRAGPAGPGLYRDARVLLVPYRVDNRPRVVAEAQANGIPVIVADSPALVEAVGGGGLVVKPDDLDGWCRSLRSVWDDPASYEALAEAARRHSLRDEISAAAVANRFDEFLRALDRGRRSDAQR
jgi:glycosyltransferase involved in cell wall biosynthesis